MSCKVTALLSYTTPYHHNGVRSARLIESLYMQSSSSRYAHIALLIEGLAPHLHGDKKPGISHCQEVNLAQKICYNNKLISFDCIHSCNWKNLADVFQKRYKLKDHIILAIFIIDFYHNFAEAPYVTIDTFLKPTFDELIYRGVYEDYPDWLESLRDKDFINTYKLALQETFSSLNKFKRYGKAMLKTIIETSNEASAQVFFEHLKKHPEITEVYGLIGSAHLSFLDRFAKEKEYVKISSTCRENHLKIPFQGSMISVHLFGGWHGKWEHYNNLARFAIKQGLSISTPRHKIDSYRYLEHQYRYSETRKQIKTSIKVASRIKRAQTNFKKLVEQFKSQNISDIEMFGIWILDNLERRIFENEEEFNELVLELCEEGFELQIVFDKNDFEKAMLKCKDKFFTEVSSESKEDEEKVTSSSDSEHDIEMFSIDSENQPKYNL